MKKCTKIVVSIIVIIVFVVVISKTRKQSTNGNIANMGLVAAKGKHVYYNKYEKGIFSTKNGREKQLTDETAYSLNMVGDEIFYLTIADFNKVVIKSVDINGENRKNIATISTSISKINIENGFIYYSNNENGNGIARIDLNGENETILWEENVQDFQVEGEKVFYVSQNNEICKVSEAEQKEVLNQKARAKKIQIVENWIYYYDENEKALFRMKKNGQNNELVSVLVKNDMYNVSGKYVYYVDQENRKIARMKIGKSNKCDDIININLTKTKINIAGDELYYLDKSSDESQTYQMYRVKVTGDETNIIEY